MEIAMPTNLPYDDRWKNVGRSFGKALFIVAKIVAFVALIIWVFPFLGRRFGPNFLYVIAFLLWAVAGLRLVWRARFRSLRFGTGSLFAVATLASLYLVAAAPLLRTASFQFRFLYVFWFLAILISALHRRLLRQWVLTPGWRTVVGRPVEEINCPARWKPHIVWAGIVSAPTAILAGIIEDNDLRCALSACAIISALAGHWSIYQMTFIRFYATGVEVLRQRYHDRDFEWRLVPTDGGAQLVGKCRDGAATPQSNLWPTIPPDRIEEAERLLADRRKPKEATTDSTDAHG